MLPPQCFHHSSAARLIKGFFVFGFKQLSSDGILQGRLGRSITMTRTMLGAGQRSRTMLQPICQLMCPPCYWKLYPHISQQGHPSVDQISLHQMDESITDQHQLVQNFSSASPLSHRASAAASHPAASSLSSGLPSHVEITNRKANVQNNTCKY